MEAKTLLRLIRNDIAHLEEITCDFDTGPLPSADEVGVALVHTNALLRELEMLNKLANKYGNSSTVFISTDEAEGKIPEPDNQKQVKPELFQSETEAITKFPTPEIKKADVSGYQEVPIEKESIDDQQKVIPDVSDIKGDLPVKESKKGGKTLGETLGESHQMVNDILSQNKSESGYKIMPINSIWDGIGINDRFLFIRELFENSSEQFETTVSALDDFKTIQDAVNYLKMSFKWNKTEASQKFLVLVKRRFNN